MSVWWLFLASSLSSRAKKPTCMATGYDHLPSFEDQAGQRWRFALGCRKSGAMQELTQGPSIPTSWTEEKGWFITRRSETQDLRIEALVCYEVGKYRSVFPAKVGAIWHNTNFAYKNPLPPSNGQRWPPRSHSHALRSSDRIEKRR